MRGSRRRGADPPPPPRGGFLDFMYLQSFVMNFELIFLICFFLVDRNVANFFKQYIEALGGRGGRLHFTNDLSMAIPFVTVNNQ